MHRYHEHCILPYTPTQMLNMVADIESYPHFLPWCRAARIIKRNGDSFLGELVISFSHLTERYTSKVTVREPAQEQAGEIAVALVSGPFKHLSNHWQFIPHADGCEVRLDLEFQFKSALLDRLIGGMFGRACEKMVTAFTARANALYGVRETT